METTIVKLGCAGQTLDGESEKPMVFSPAAAELERMAGVYSAVSHELHATADLSRPYVTRLHNAEAVEWESPAGSLFKVFTTVLRAEGMALEEYARELAAEASVISGDLADAAQTAHALAAAVDGFLSDLPDLVGGILAERALSAINDAGEFIRFIEDYGGIPPRLLSL